ncbi:alpha-L-rhamnosidase [Paenibacillus sp. MY03]|uniref:family 78 glycoside hydrolase catalytic domain n=1 Tax=Paenibacillus sp. MY03 TaxID=302980 RepID=UPI000B3C8533|nr:family 78 glycoside hydrolase catalytic domain [Paenibacillus sp. MY03]OUS72187.1 alpha-L-rhamnosidase [Paenibacillus sp. MY03]
MDKQWTAKWITDREFDGLVPIDLYRKELAPAQPYVHRADLRNRHMLFRKVFDVQGEGGSSEAYLDISGDDYYKVYINGQFVGQGPAQSPHFHYYYNRFPVSNFLQEGLNVIAVHVYYHGLISHSFNSGDYRQGLIAEIVLGDKVAVQTDESWKYRMTNQYGDGHLTGYDTQFVEHLDNRFRVQGWQNLNDDDQTWQMACELGDNDYQLFLQPTPPLSVYEVDPTSIVQIEDGYWIDFGQEVTGQLRLSAIGREGGRIEIRYGEECLENGRVRYDMRCNCLFQEFWTLSGNDDSFEGFDYKAFRYVEVLTDPDIVIDTGSVKAIVRHYPWQDQACVFSSSSSLLNGIWSICSNGVKYGSQETYVDCPSREKGQYLGDNTVITHAHAYLGGDLRLFRKSLQDFATLSERVCPGLMAVASGSYMQEIADFSFQWPIQLLQYYRQSGDIAFLREMCPVAENMLRYFSAFRREDGLIAGVKDKWNLIDWPENMRDGYDFSADQPDRCHNVLNAFYYGAMKTTAEIQRLVAGEVSDELQRNMVQTCRSFSQVFYDNETMLYVDSEDSKHSSLHANALPLLFGLTTQEARQPIVELIRAKRLNCGVYMAYFVLNALAEAGEYELVYNLITSDDLHSWANMIKEGATTCFEAWSKDLKANTSLCHPWASSPIPILIEHIIGLKPAEPGWRSISFSPRLPKELCEVKLAFETPSGRISFTANDGDIQLIVPEGVTVIEQ